MVDGLLVLPAFNLSTASDKISLLSEHISEWKKAAVYISYIRCQLDDILLFKNRFPAPYEKHHLLDHSI